MIGDNYFLNKPTILLNLIFNFGQNCLFWKLSQYQTNKIGLVRRSELRIREIGVIKVHNIL